MPRGRKKTFEQKLIEKLVACPHPSAPKSEREAFWGREMKILKSVFKEFPDKEFWEKVTFEKKFKIGNYLAPLTIALFANSPFTENKLSGFLSYRGKVWQETNRGGIMPITFESVNFEKYVDNVINYPILFLKKNKRYCWF